MARLPEHWKCKNEIRKVHKTTYTTRMGRWLVGKGMETWFPRQNAKSRRQSRAKPNRRRANIIELDAGADVLPQPPQTLMGIPDGHDLYGQDNPYSNAAHRGAGSSSFDTDDDGWDTTRETSILPDNDIIPDIDINVPPRNQYHNPYGHGDPYFNGAHIGAGSYPFDTDDTWVTTRETSILPDPNIHALPPNQFHNPSGNHQPEYHNPNRPDT